MPELSSLGDEKRSRMKFLYFGIVVAITIYAFNIFINKFSLLASEQLSIIISNLTPIIITIIGMGVVGFFLTKSGLKNKILVLLFLVLLGVNIFFLRSLITIFNAQVLPSGIGLSLIYTAMGIISSIVIGINTLSPKIREPIDTVLVEGKKEAVWQPSGKIKIGIIIGIIAVTGIYISSTGQAFVKAPVFGLSESLYSEAIVSAVVGGILETAFFFAVIQPVIHSLVFKMTQNTLFAVVGGVIGVTVLFFLFHTTVYAYNQAALTSVGIFGLLNSIATVVFRDNGLNAIWHGSNNYFVVFFRMTVFSVFF